MTPILVERARAPTDDARSSAIDRIHHRQRPSRSIGRRVRDSMASTKM